MPLTPICGFKNVAWTPFGVRASVPTLINSALEHIK